MNTVLIAFDSFKETISAKKACLTAMSAIKEVDSSINVIILPVTDGGDGMTEAYECFSDYNRINCTVKGPYEHDTNAFYLMKGKKAIIEMASAAGILLTAERHGQDASTYGVGELLKDAVSRGCNDIIIGLGGSATNDAGAGFITALGAKLYDKNGNDVVPTGSGLAEICSADLSKAVNILRNCKITLRCDVNNHLCGQNGATRVFGPQKGIYNPDLICSIDNNLYRYGKLLENLTAKQLIDADGSGAAGGFAVSCAAVSDTVIESGIESFFKDSGFEEKVKSSDLIICGEGRIDGQTDEGKAIKGICSLAKKYYKPAVAVCGEVSDDYIKLFNHGLTAAFSIQHYAKDYELIKSRAEKDLYDTIRNIIKLIKAVR